MEIAGLRLVEFDGEQTDELVSLWRASFEHGVGVVDPHPIAEQRAYFVNEVAPTNTIMVAMLGDDLVGFVAASSDSLDHLYVSVEHLRCGIGTRLLEWAKQNSDGSLELYTFERNLAAQQFYELHGFQIVERGFEEGWQLADLKYFWSA